MPVRQHQSTAPIAEHRPPAADGSVAAECAVCPHPWDFHDRIAARYCTATISGKFNRGCVCTAYTDAAEIQQK
ncbi:RGCVC family protein [Actinophytocola sp.]|uniref:RGCVC family protein n=1 Tax=Actinophytocola sp. TaxID=1872138 RepID=UPI002D7EF5CB|nr:RGCVC family protein [Actinophytocola sp.]HET9140383.1 RGCVC family protein [Actinophytocola sp.]